MCRKEEASLYLASVAKPDRAIKQAHEHYQNLYLKSKTPILMVNAVGNCEDFEACGKSGMWSAQNRISGDGEEVFVWMFLFRCHSSKTLIR